MGCFGSRIRLEDEDLRPGERGRLLNDQEHPSFDDVLKDNYGNGGGTESGATTTAGGGARSALELSRHEQDALGRIVQHTAETLIDISGAQTVERLQPQDVSERIGEYRRSLAHVHPSAVPSNVPVSRNKTLPKAPLRSLHHGQEQQLLRARDPQQWARDQQQMEALSQHVQRALETIRIQDVGPFLVHLPVQ